MMGALSTTYTHPKSAFNRSGSSASLGDEAGYRRTSYYCAIRLISKYTRIPSVPRADILNGNYSTVTLTGADAMPLATTTSELAPVSIFAGTSNSVDTTALPVATPIVLWSWVRA